MSKIRKIYLDLCMCSVFRSVLDKPLLLHLADYARETDPDKKIRAYAAMISEVYSVGGSLSEAVRRIVFEDENVYIRLRAGKKEIPERLSQAAERELSVLSELAGLTPEDFGADMKLDYVSPFISEKCNLAEEYEERVRNIDRHGYGIFASHPMFRLDDLGTLSPIVSADKTTPDSFIGYEDERRAVMDNTRALISGRPALNLLLCGDAGTGKSSTVKAAVNYFYNSGLRLIELRKDQLSFLPYVMGRISENPLKFIIFIDDLSFNKNDDNFSMLKAALEGSASAKADNAVIYATSNRRHIVRETFDEREGSDVHRNDTMQEKLSLSDRFGLVVLFQKPNKKLYLEIVRELAKRYGIDADPVLLDMKAEEFALRRGNRSPRCAEQFIKTLL